MFRAEFRQPLLTLSLHSLAFRVLAQRAFCAMEIFLRAAADNLLRPTLAARFAPFSNASIRCSIFASSVISRWCLLRSSFSNFRTNCTLSPWGAVEISSGNAILPATRKQPRGCGRQGCGPNIRLCNYGPAAVPIFEAAFANTLLIVLAMVPMLAIAPSASKARSSAYSVRSCPFCSRQRIFNRFFILLPLGWVDFFSTL